MNKPFNHKTYGSIPHLPGSNAKGDRYVNKGMVKIATEKIKNKHQKVICQEKSDGSCCGVYKKNGIIYPVTRSGNRAITSSYEQHKIFAKWAMIHGNRFRKVLKDGERLVGEWMIQAHGTMYHLKHEPFIAFDIMKKQERLPYFDFLERINNKFVTPYEIHVGGACSIDKALRILGKHGHHGAVDPAEGAVWRIETNRLVNPGETNKRKTTVDFLCKYIRPEKEPGCYLKNKKPLWNVSRNYIKNVLLSKIKSRKESIYT